MQQIRKDIQEKHFSNQKRKLMKYSVVLESRRTVLRNDIQNPPLESYDELPRQRVYARRTSAWDFGNKSNRFLNMILLKYISFLQN